MLLSSCSNVNLLFNLDKNKIIKDKNINIINVIELNINENLLKNLYQATRSIQNKVLIKDILEEFNLDKIPDKIYCL